MKNAIKILSIIYIPLIAIQILAYLIISISFFMAAANPNIYPNVDAQSAVYVFTVYAIVFLFVTLCLVPGLILNIILLKKSSSNTDFSKSTWITYGVLSLVFGSTVPGILAIIYGAIKEEPTIHSQEVHFQDKQDDFIKPSDYDSSDRF